MDPNASRDGVPLFVGTAAFGPDGRRVVGAPASIARWVAGMWDSRTGADVAAARPDDWGSHNKLAQPIPGGRIVPLQPFGVWAADLARLEVPLKHPNMVPDRACASPDGRLVAAASTEARLVALFDSRTGEVVNTRSGHGGGVTALAFSRDGALLASGSKDGTARVWDVASGAERLAVPQPGVTQVAFTPDGGHLVAAGDGARRWPVRPPAEARRPRDLSAAERARVGLDP